MKNYFKTFKYFEHIKLGILIIGVLFFINYLYVESARFTPEPVEPTGTWYRVSTSVSGYGTIYPTYQDVLSPNTTMFTVTPNAGYRASVVGCTGYLSGGTYTTGMIGGNCTVYASFTKIPMVVNYFRANPSSVDMGGTTYLEWSASNAVSCTVTGPNFNKTGTSNSGEKTPAIYEATTYTLKCDDGVTSTGSSSCIGTVSGSKAVDGSVPGPYEGQSCSQFTSQTTCLQGWVTHGCRWVSS